MHTANVVIASTTGHKVPGLMGAVRCCDMGHSGSGPIGEVMLPDRFDVLR